MLVREITDLVILALPEAIVHISFEYLLPIKENENDSIEVSNWKKKSNMFLNFFLTDVVVFV